MFASKKWHLSRGFSGKYWCVTFDSCGLRYIRSGASAGWPRDCGLTPTRKTRLEQHLQWSGSKLRARVIGTLIRPLSVIENGFSSVVLCCFFIVQRVLFGSGREFCNASSTSIAGDVFWCQNWNPYQCYRISGLYVLWLAYGLLLLAGFWWCVCCTVSTWIAPFRKVFCLSLSTKAARIPAFDAVC